jgi:hypothetical protein
MDVPSPPDPKALIRERAQVAMKLACTYPAASYQFRMYKSEADGLLIAMTSWQPAAPYSLDPAEQEAFERGLAEGQFILETAKPPKDSR